MEREGKKFSEISGVRGGVGLTGGGLGRGISAPDPDSLPACLFALRLSFSPNGA